MTLNKRYLRNIKENLPFYIASTILTMVSLLLFYLFYIAGTGIKDYGDKFFEEKNVEDATFSTYIEIPDDEISNIEDTYNITFEKEHFMNITGDDYNVRVFKANHKIDLYEVIDGKDISDDDEILISKGYADNMNVEIGDSIEIAGKSYKVAGTFLRPDYLYMLENTDDSYKNITTFFLAYMSDNAFDKLGAKSCEYKVIYGKNSDEKQFRSDMNDKYKVITYLNKNDNTRIEMVDGQAEMFIIMSFVFLVLIPLVSMALISLIIGRKIKNEQKIIGTLAAMGYTNRQLMRHYGFMAMIPGALGGVLVSALTKIVQQPYGEMSLADYEPMPVTFKLPVYIMIIGIVLPTAIYVLKARSKVKKLLKEDTVMLLNGNYGGKSRIKHILADKDGKVKGKYAIRSIISNPGRSFVVFLGTFLGAMIMSIAFMFVDSLEYMAKNGASDMGTFKYEYVLNSLETEPLDDAECIVISKYEYNNEAFTMLGAQNDISLLNLNTTDNKKADLSKGYYVTNVMAYVYDIKAGDEFTFINPATTEEKTITIEGIIANDSQKLVIGNIDNVRKLAGLDDDVYNSVMSEKSMDFGDKVSKVITSDDIKEQMNTVIDEMDVIIYSLAVIGAIICMSALYVAVNMLVAENRHNISMLKVLGLSDREINSMVIDVNHVIVPVGIVVGIFAGYGIMNIVFKIYSAEEGVLYNTAISAKSIVISSLCTLACYIISLILVRKKAGKVDMVESLKDNRE